MKKRLLYLRNHSIFFAYPPPEGSQRCANDLVHVVILELCEPADKKHVLFCRGQLIILRKNLVALLVPDRIVGIPG